MRASNKNITKIMLTEFLELTKSDIEIQIDKNYDTLRETNTNSKITRNNENIELDIMIKKFYLSLSNYCSKNTGSDFANNNMNYSSFTTFKKNYLKFLKINGQPVN